MLLSAAARVAPLVSDPAALMSQAGLSGIGTRPPIKELFALWPCLIPRELVPVNVDMVEA